MSSGFLSCQLCWKLPKFLIKKRSSLLVVGPAVILTSIGARARPFIIALAIACLSGFMISAAETPWVVAGTIGMALTLIWWLRIAAFDLLRPTVLTRTQKKFINWALQRRIIEKIPKPTLPNRVTIQSWTVEDAKEFRDSTRRASSRHLNYGPVFPERFASLAAAGAFISGFVD